MYLFQEQLNYNPPRKSTGHICKFVGTGLADLYKSIKLLVLHDEIVYFGRTVSIMYLIIYY